MMAKIIFICKFGLPDPVVACKLYFPFRRFFLLNEVFLVKKKHILPPKFALYQKK
jgi:hypothetical protein